MAERGRCVPFDEEVAVPGKPVPKERSTKQQPPFDCNCGYKKQGCASGCTEMPSPCWCFWVLIDIERPKLFKIPEVHFVHTMKLCYVPDDRKFIEEALFWKFPQHRSSARITSSKPQKQASMNANCIKHDVAQDAQCTYLFTPQPLMDQGFIVLKWPIRSIILWNIVCVVQKIGKIEQKKVSMRPTQNC